MSLYLFRASGPSSNGQFEGLLSALEPHPGTLLDLDQAVDNGEVNMTFLLSLPSQAEGILADLEGHATDLGLHSTAATTTDTRVPSASRAAALCGYVATVVGDSLGASALARLVGCFSTFGLEVTQAGRLSEIPPSGSRRCFDLHLCGELAAESALRAALYELSQQLRCDIALQSDDHRRYARRLVAFDMDSTLIQTEVINELAREHGVEARVAEITERAMNGELDFDASLRERLGLMRGLDTSVLERIAARLPVSPGAERLVSALKRLGIKTVILSGGFNYFGQHIKSLLGIDEVHANELEIVDGKLTGQVVGPIVNGARKAALLTELATANGLEPWQVVAVGDGANDLPMLKVAGLGVAYHAKPVVREAAAYRICHTDLDSLLYYMGLRDQEIDALPR